MESDDELDPGVLNMYYSGYQLISEVIADFDPVRIVDHAWLIREQINERMASMEDYVPALEYIPVPPTQLAVELLAAIGDLIQSDAALRPLFERQIASRSELFRALQEQAFEAEVDQ